MPELATTTAWRMLEAPGRRSGPAAPLDGITVARAPARTGAGAAAGVAGARRPSDRPTGAWLAGDAPGHRRFADIGALGLECGERLPVTVAYETWGSLAADGANAILVEHALTGDSHAAGAAGDGHPSPGWWDALIGPGRPLDTDRYFIVAPNVLGGCQGTTGPASAGPDGRLWGPRFPRITVRDQVAAERALMEALGIRRWALVIGGSMGGMRALEWAVAHPDEVAALAVIASGARASADQIAWNSAQIAAIRASAGFAGGDYHHLDAEHGPAAGLGAARRIAHTTYRTSLELETRFGTRTQPDRADPERDVHQVTAYLDHHADKLARRFDANSYITLAQTMSDHDIGRARGGVSAALRRVAARSLIVAVDSDRLFPVSMSREIGDGIAGSTLRIIESPSGHDAFLIESAQLGHWVRELLAA